MIKPRRRDQAIAVAFASPISDAEIAALRKNGAIRQGTSNSRVRLQYTAQVVAHELLHSFGVVEHFDVQREMNATAEFDRLTNIAIMESNISYLAPPAWAVSKRSYAQVRTFLSLLNATQSNCLRETGNRSLTLKKKSKKRKRRK